MIWCSAISVTRPGCSVKMKGHSSFSPSPFGSQLVSPTPIGAASGPWNQLLNCGNSGLPNTCHIFQYQKPALAAMPAKTPTPKRKPAATRDHSGPQPATRARHSASA